jgi:hypothetical protein
MASGRESTWIRCQFLEPKQSLDTLPLAMELTKQGRPTIVIERKLTWPKIDQSVGTMQAGVICAEQWLAKQGAIRPIGGGLLALNRTPRN